MKHPLITDSWPIKFGQYSSVNILPKKPTFPEGSTGTPISIVDTYASLHIETSLYNTAWTNWDKRSYNWEFEIRAAFSPNALLNAAPHDLDKEPREIYELFAKHFISELRKHLGESAVQKKTAPAEHKDFNDEYVIHTQTDCFSFDNNVYLEMSERVDTRGYERNLFVSFSDVVVSEKGSRRAKLHRNTCSVHKSGTKITTDDFLKRIREKLDIAYAVIEARFEENLEANGLAKT